MFTDINMQLVNYYYPLLQSINCLLILIYLLFMDCKCPCHFFDCPCPTITLNTFSHPTCHMVPPFAATDRQQWTGVKRSWLLASHHLYKRHMEVSVLSWGVLSVIIYFRLGFSIFNKLETLTYCTDDDPWMIGTAKVRDDRVAGIPLFDVQKCLGAPGGPRGPAAVKNWMTPGRWSHDRWLGVFSRKRRNIDVQMEDGFLLHCMLMIKPQWNTWCGFALMQSHQCHP